MDARSASRAPLDRAAIVAAGVALADAEGIHELSMRRLADRLGYKVMALYNHVANKDDVLTGMGDAVAAEIESPEVTASSGSEALSAVRQLSVAIRAALVAHPWAADVWLTHLPGPARSRQMEQLLRLLHTSGLDPDLAHLGFHAVNNHVIGYTLQEMGMSSGTSDAERAARAEEYLGSISPETHPYTVAHVHEHLAGETASSFEIVLDLLLDGLVRMQRER